MLHANLYPSSTNPNSAGLRSALISKHLIAWKAPHLDPADDSLLLLLRDQVSLVEKDLVSKGHLLDCKAHVSYH